MFSSIFHPSDQSVSDHIPIPEKEVMVVEGPVRSAMRENQEWLLGGPTYQWSVEEDLKTATVILKRW